MFGPRGTGKSTWVAAELPLALRIDLLDQATFLELSGHAERLAPMAEARRSRVVVIDEVQKLPALLDEVHRLIETKKWRFVLTGSSARKLRRSGANLLAGRARTIEMHPFASSAGVAIDGTGNAVATWTQSDGTAPSIASSAFR